MNIELTSQEIAVFAALNVEPKNTLSEEGEAIAKMCQAMETLTPLSRLAVVQSVFLQCQNSFKVQAHEMRTIGAFLNRVADKLQEKATP